MKMFKTVPYRRIFRFRSRTGIVNVLIMSARVNMWQQSCWYLLYVIGIAELRDNVVLDPYKCMVPQVPSEMPSGFFETLGASSALK